MIFEKLAVRSAKHRWQKAIEDNRVSSVKLLDDGSTMVIVSVEVKFGDRTIFNMFDDYYPANDPNTKALLEIIDGNFSNGKVHYFQKSLTDQNWEELWTPENLVKDLRAGYAKRAEMTPEGKILVWVDESGMGLEVAMDFSSEDYLREIQAVTGPLEVGQVYEFQSSAD